MLKTKNYKLNKPEKNDTVDIENINENMDILDKSIKEIDNKIKNVEVPVKSVNGKTGEVKLTSEDINVYSKNETDNKFATKDELGNIDVPVTKVNGKTGNIKLTADDIIVKEIGETVERAISIGYGITEELGRVVDGHTEKIGNINSQLAEKATQKYVDDKVTDITTEQENMKVDINNIIDKNTPSIPNDSCIYYYVDNESGKDDNDGTSLSTAFKTLEKAWSKIPYLFCNNYIIKIIGNYNSLVTLNSKKSMCGNRIVISPNSSNIVCKFTNGIRINDFSGGVYDALLLFKINFGNTIRIRGSRGVEVSDCILNFDKPGTGLYVETSTIYTVSNTFSSNINTCIFGDYLSYIYSVNNKGKGNFGLKASSGSTIRKYKEQPKGTTSNELTEIGGKIE